MQELYRHIHRGLSILVGDPSCHCCCRRKSDDNIVYLFTCCGDCNWWSRQVRAELTVLLRRIPIRRNHDSVVPGLRSVKENLPSLPVVTAGPDGGIVAADEVERMTVAP